MKALARFSKTIAKYAYYPMLIGFIALCSVAVNRGKPLGALSTLVAAVCDVLCIVALLSKTLYKKAGIDDKIV